MVSEGDHISGKEARLKDLGALALNDSDRDGLETGLFVLDVGQENALPAVSIDQRLDRDDGRFFAPAEFDLSVDE